MSEKTLKLDISRVSKKEFYKSKQPINLDLMKVDQIVVSDKFKHSDGGKVKVKLLTRCVLSYLK